jgi:hypothetical protein
MKLLRNLRASVRRKAPSPLGAVARGLVAGAIGAGAQALFLRFSRRGPEEMLAPQGPPAFRTLVGALFGGVWAVWRESFRPSPLAFGALAWVAGDNLGPKLHGAAAPFSTHPRALQAHIVYGLTTAAAYALLRDLGPVPLAALPAVLALQMRAWAMRTPPGRLALRNSPWPQRFAAPLLQKMALA